MKVAMESGGERALGGVGLPCVVTQVREVRFSQLISVKDLWFGY